MSDRTHSPGGPQRPIPFRAPRLRRGGRPRRRRLKKLRLALIAIGLAALALISTVFGMMMAVASDIPALENRAEYRNARNSVLYDDHGRKLGILTGERNRIIVRSDQISPAMKHAIIAVEDERFFENPGVDIRGIARAFVSDVTGGERQGASTITQQFVKKALAADSHRTVFEKLREAAIAYHLTRRWSKEKILTEYLNIVYFGSGAYGIESAARTYFSSAHPDCGTQQVPCASELTPAEAALLAGMVQSPSAYDPTLHPLAARTRRDVVLQKMLQQGYLSPSGYHAAIATPLPTRRSIRPPAEHTKAPYFTSWVKEQVVQRFGPQRTFGGGLHIKTTLDLDLQNAAESAVSQYMSGPGMPSAALVAIDNRSGAVRAMVGGSDYEQRPFNLATQGRRQPGSSFKPFVLAQALREGVSPQSIWPSRKRVFDVPHSREKFVVNNYGGEYFGTSTLAQALVHSDNAVFAAVGIKVGDAKVARLAKRMGIRTPVSHNYAIALGGLHTGVTVIDMAHAYETLAEHGERVSDALASPDHGPTGISRVTTGSGHDAKTVFANRTVRHRVLPASIADETALLMRGVVQSGTGRAAYLGPEIPVSGKTGTTENYGDAWFVGFTPRLTVAVWVGYPDRLKPMETLYNGGPVTGGTYPALIWRSFMTQALQVQAAREADAGEDGGQAPQATGGYTPPPQSTGSQTTTAPEQTTTAPAAGAQGEAVGGEQTGPAPDGATGGGTGGGTTGTPPSKPAPGGGTTGGGQTPAPTGGGGGDATGQQPPADTSPAPSGGGTTGGGTTGGGQTPAPTGGDGGGGGGSSGQAAPTPTVTPTKPVTPALSGGAAPSG